MIGRAPSSPAHRRPFPPSLHVLDRAEQVVILAFFTVFVWRMLGAASAYAPAVIVSETAVVLFTLIRRRAETISLRPSDWLLATAATLAPLLVMPGADPYPALAAPGLFLILFGNYCQVWAKLTLRRSFGITPANRGVKVTGAYRFVRHPMYAGYLLCHIGVLAVMFSPYNLAVHVIGWTAQILRLQAEERLLGEDPAYRAYMAQVRWRLLPGIF